MLERLRAEVEVALVVDLEGQRRVVEQYLAERSIQPTQTLYLPDECRADREPHPEFLRSANQAIQQGLWGVVISTEPKAHFAYAHWAVSNGLHVFLDKPITAEDMSTQEPRVAKRLLSDYLELRRCAERSGSLVLIQTQRRAHVGYEFIHEYLAEFVAAFEVPLTYLDVYHADGMWNMPNEFFTRENHPYSYGYGKLMHSGYHFIDLFSWFASLNQSLGRVSADVAELTTRHVRPYDFISQVGINQYKRLFRTDERFASIFNNAQSLQRLQRFGETDVLMLCQFLRGDAVILSGSLSLLQTSFSRRAWTELPDDTYKSNGRVRHERLTIQVAHLLSIQVHSYQSYEASERTPDESGIGHYDHFDAHFFRNQALVGGKAFETLRLGDSLQQQGARDADYLGHNEFAREEMFRDFLDERSSRGGIELHELTVKLTAAAYYSILSRNRGASVSPRVSLTCADSDEWLSESAEERAW